MSLVALPVSAWIEISITAWTASLRPVALHVSAWIEISDANSDAKLIKESLQELTGVAIEIC